MGKAQMKLVIDRDRWLRGEGDAKSCLLRSSDDKMCCLGFMAKQVGYDDETIQNINTPCGVVNDSGGLATSKWPEGFVKPGIGTNGLIWDTAEISDLMTVNDSFEMTEWAREHQLTRMMDQLGVDVEFVNGETPVQDPGKVEGHGV